MAKTFGYKKNRIVPAAEAQAVGEELERIRGAKGELTPANVVDESRPKEALLHKELDLHISARERAEFWSRHKARNIINVVTVIPERPEGSTEQPSEPVQAYVNVVEGSVSDPDSSRAYETIEAVLADPKKRAALVARALEKLLRVQREFRHLKELETVWNAIEEVVTREPA